MPRPDRHRAALVASMQRMLRRRGYRATGLTELLDDAGATNGSLYHHFPRGKEQLADAAIRQSGAEVESVLRSLLQGSEPIAAMQTWIDGAIAALRADPRDGCPIAPTALEAASINDDLRIAAHDAFALWTGVLEAALLPTRPAGIARDQARTVLAALEGALLLDRTAHGTEHLQALRVALPNLLAAGPEAD